MELTTIVKFLSLTLAAGFAILGTTTDYKKDGQVTKWGRVAIIGVIVSGLLSSTLLGIEENTKARQKRESEALANEAEIKANNDKRALNEQFDKLVVKAEENIKATAEALIKTDKVASDLEQSVADQKEIMAETQNISGGVSKSLDQQGNILGQMQDQVALQEKTFEKTEGLQAQQNFVLQNTLRALNSFRQFKITYRLRFPLDTPKLRNFVNNLKAYASTKEQGDKNPEIKVFRVENSAAEEDEPEAEEDGIEQDKAAEDTEEVTAVEVPMDSPYFLTIKAAERKQISDLLTKSPVALKVYKDIEAPINKMDLIIRTGAWALTEDRDKSMPNRGPFSHSFNLTVVYAGGSKIKRKNGIYIDVETDIKTSWADRTHQIQSFVDLPDTRLNVEIPCGSELTNFYLRTGENYGTFYRFGAPKEYQSGQNCKAVYFPKKSHFKFPE